MRPQAQEAAAISGDADAGLRAQLAASAEHLQAAAAREAELLGQVHKENLE